MIVKTNALNIAKPPLSSLHHAFRSARHESLAARPAAAIPVAQSAPHERFAQPLLTRRGSATHGLHSRLRVPTAKAAATAAAAATASSARVEAPPPSSAFAPRRLCLADRAPRVCSRNVLGSGRKIPHRARTSRPSMETIGEAAAATASGHACKGCGRGRCGGGRAHGLLMLLRQRPTQGFSGAAALVARGRRTQRRLRWAAAAATTVMPPAAAPVVAVAAVPVPGGGRPGPGAVGGGAAVAR